VLLDTRAKWRTKTRRLTLLMISPECYSVSIGGRTFSHVHIFRYLICKYPCDEEFGIVFGSVFRVVLFLRAQIYSIPGHQCVGDRTNTGEIPSGISNLTALTELWLFDILATPQPDIQPAEWSVFS